MDVLGFGADGKVAYGIPSETRIHAAEFGEVGSGKSETLKLLMLQNIQRKQGFLLIDPHGDLAKEVLALIPKELQDNVIYISPSTIHQTGRAVRINPLEVKNQEERHIISMSLVNALHNLYIDSWGDRLEAILRNGCNALVEIEGATLRDLRMLVSDDRARELYLSKITSKDTIHFWRHTFKQYSKESGSAAYNKLDKILATPPIAAMLDAPKSSIDFGEIMDSGKFVIVDLGSGSSDDITAFLGSIILHMFYVEAKKRADRDTELRNPFYFYIDESHLFSPFALREILNTMRKFKVKVTIATQTINAYPKRIADEISALVRTIICFKCDLNTAHMFRNLLPTEPEVQVALSLHTLAFYSQAKPPIKGVAATKQIKPVQPWQPIAKLSVENYGEAVSIHEYLPVIRQSGEYPLIIACESIILLLIKKENMALTREEIYQKLNEKFGVDQRLVFESIESLVKERYLDRKLQKEPPQVIQRFGLSDLAKNTFFSTTAMGRRAGSPLHLAAIFSITKIMQDQFKHCIVDLGDQGGQRPDLLIFEPDTYHDEIERLRYDLENWNEKIIAVEVETDPTKHGKQIIINYQKNFEKGFEIWFTVFSEKHKQYIIKTLADAGIDEKLYQIIILDEDKILESYEKLEKDSTTHVNEFEAQILNMLGQEPGSVKKIVSQMPVTAESVLRAVKSLEMKKLVTPGAVEKVSEITNPKTNEIRKKRKKEEYSELSQKGEELTKPSENTEVPQIKEEKKASGPEPTESPQKMELDKKEMKIEKPKQELEQVTSLKDSRDETLVDLLKMPDYPNKDVIIMVLKERGYTVKIKGDKVRVYQKKIKQN